MFTNGINALIQEAPESSLTLFLPCEDTGRGWPSVTQKRALTRTDHAGTLISASSLQNCEK